MSSLISDSGWEKYQKVINDASDTFNQVVITWKKSVGGIDRFGEDNKTERFQNIYLKCLVEYNKNRVWPATGYTETGELDKQTQVILFNLDYLRNCGYVDSNNNFMFEPSTDRIIHNNVIWKCSGMTNLSQAGNKDLLCQLILQKDVIPTSAPTR